MKIMDHAPSRRFHCMQLPILIFSLLLAPLFLSDSARGNEDDAAPPSFSRIDLSQTGGFAGIQYACSISSDGRYTITSHREGDIQRELSAETLATLSAAIEGLDWQDFENPRQEGGVIADGFHYELTLITEESEQHLEYSDGTYFSEENMRNLQSIFQILTSVITERN